MNLNELYNIIDKYYPKKLSDELVAMDNGYDNSGIIFDSDEVVSGVVVCLDLTKSAVDYAKKMGANTILTHHPAIYLPIKRVDGALKYAIQQNISVISMHLNFDSANLGIDYHLAKGLGAKDFITIQSLPSGGGYGRVFSVETTLHEFVKNTEREFGTKVRCYGDKDARIKRVASFCGAGLSEAFLNLDVDLFVSSDIAHHKILMALEKGKCLIDITHYKSENYGLRKIFEYLSSREETKNLKMYFFCDDRFI